MANRLANSNSPYLLQHQDNPVDWHPWGSEALARAKTEDKPIFLSIGYAACHWCHVMAHESFEDEATAAYMNEHFINIKVDREERPDIDGIYMTAVVAMTGSGGWPMSVFMTPDGQPFLGGTYFPPVARYNMPSFMDALQHVQRLWSEERDKVLENGRIITQHLQAQGTAPAGGDSLQPEALSQAVMALAQAYDWRHGGWGQAPKFPQPMTIDFLLARATQGDQLALDMARHAMQSMALGGMYDVVGGGFARYSVDDYWRVPHFEKMLYDNALLARAYLHGYLVTEDEALRQVCERTLDFVARELRHADGGFYSSLDADSEGEEGKFYVWSLAEIQASLDKHLAELVIAAYGVTEAGNFDGHNVLQRVKDDAALATQFGIDAAAVRQQLEAAHATLLTVRADRVRPGTDDKVLTAWNGLMLIAFAEAARYLNRPDYLQVAQTNADFLLRELHDGSRLLRSWRAGQAAHNGYLEDYAALTLGLLALYQSDGDVRWYAAAEKLAGELTQHFADPAGGFFDTRDDHETLLTRPKDMQDNATPSGGALAALALLQLHAYTGKAAWHETASTMLAGISTAALRYPTAFAQWLCAGSWLLAGGREIAVVGEAADALLHTLWSSWRPFDVAAVSPYPPPAGSPPLLAERPLKDGKATAYVCRNFACQLPVNSADELAQQLQT
ncbi:MAG: thioredoxin domain-containing protein [Anaerolineales bacterium]|nr:MAG: thioredoxin domain-containing protein [Anaerolineales bacterium]